MNFQSPLVWDAFAISTYFAVSLMFWYVGLIPDLAAARDRTAGVRRKLYGFFALGWQGTDGQWHHYAAAYGLFAALATPLVVSVHSVVSWDFAMSLVPGWHSTIFAPYFVAGAIFSGLGMVLTLIIPLRHVFGLHAYVTADHFDNLGKLLIVTSLILTYSYVSEFFIAWYSANPYERSIFWFRAAGDYAPLFWLMVACNCAVPLLLFRRSIRTHTGWLFGISLLVNVGMWLERFVIIVSSLAHEFDPSGLGGYLPSWVEVGVTLGSFAWFFLFFLLFVRFLPLVSLAEVKEQLPPQDPTTVQVSTAGASRAGATSARREGRVGDGRSGKGRSEAGLVGVFRHANALTDAIRTLRRDGHSTLRGSRAVSESYDRGRTAEAQEFRSLLHSGRWPAGLRRGLRLADLYGAGLAASDERQADRGVARIRGDRVRVDHPVRRRGHADRAVRERAAACEVARGAARPPVFGRPLRPVRRLRRRAARHGAHDAQYGRRRGGV